MRVLAIIPAFNEADVIYHVIRDLNENGVDCFLLDNCSTDSTIAEAKRAGVVGVERFPDESPGYDPRCRNFYVWSAMLKRIEELSEASGYDWLIRHDADEFRLPPPGWNCTLHSAIERVDTEGFTAINHKVFNFWPTDEDEREFVPGEDVRQYVRWYDQGQGMGYDNQLKIWKNLGKVDLVSSGGHEAKFVGRLVYPERFILRHYPIRSRAHAKQKLFKDRFPRYDPDEKKRGWHFHWDRWKEENNFKKIIRSTRGMTKWA